MLSASNAFRQYASNNSKVLVKAKLTLANGEVVQLSGADFMMGGLSFTQSSSSSGSFDVGAAIVGSMSAKLNNIDGKFDEYDFDRAVIEPQIGIALDSGEEWLRKGVYNVEQPSTYGAVISLSCTDNLSLLQKPLGESGVSYPLTAREFAEAVCRKQGLSVSWKGGNADYRIEAAPDDDNVTCLQALAYAAQATGNFVACTNTGVVEFRWYDTTNAKGESSLDGGRLDEGKPYATGDSADGGNFTDYSSGDSVEGGEFGTPSFVYLDAFTSLDIGTDDVVITGVRVTAQDQVLDDGTQGEDGETAFEGSEGYVIAVDGNPFIPYGGAADAASRLAKALVGMRFRVFTATGIGDPTAEPGDRACVIDSQRHTYETYLTSLTYKVGAYGSFACNAEAPSRKSAESATVKATAYKEAKKLVEREKTARELALKGLADDLANSSGLYMSTLTQADGSTIYYMHDKPTIAESKIVWKLTATAIGVSTDGGRNYAYGFDASGKAILDRIYAIGIDADYITTGRIADAKNKNYIDLDTGECSLSASATVGGDAISTTNDLKNASAGLNKKINELATDGVVTEAERAAVNKILQTVSKEQAELTTEYNSLSNNASLPTSYKAQVLAPAYSSAFGSGGAYETLLAKIDAVVGCSTAEALDSAMADYESAYSAYSKAVDSYAAAARRAKSRIEQADAKTTAQGLVDTLDDSLTQQSVFNRLTNNGATQGIYMSNGKLYLNGSYMGVGTISNRYNSTNYWNLDTGALKAGNITATGSFLGGSKSSGFGMELTTGGRLSGYYGGEQYGYLDCSSQMKYLPTGEIWHGLQIQAKQITRISTPNISVSSSNDTSVTTTAATTGSAVFMTFPEGMPGNDWDLNEVKLRAVQVSFINGFCTTAF